MYCMKCGKEVHGNFCMNCGNKVENTVQFSQDSTSTSHASTSSKKPFYKRWWFWVLIVLFIAIIVPKDKNDDVKIDEQNLQIQAKPESVENVDYIELYNNIESYTDKWVRLSGKITSKGTNANKINYITFKDGFDGITNMIYINISPNLDENFDNALENDFVNIVGQVGNKTLGSLNINNSYIECIGLEAEQIYKTYQEQREKAEQEKIKKQKEDFINSCSTYSYEELARNPQDYVGKNVKLTGKVIQVSENTFGSGVTLRINVTKGNYGIYSDTVYCNYTYSENESKILENDIVTLYGTSKGDISYTAVLGQKITLPHIDIKYITIK